MFVYTLEQCWEVSLRSLTEEANFGKKNHLFRWSSFWSWRVCKQAKFLRLGHRKPARIHWKADAPKTEWLFGSDFDSEAQLCHFYSKMSKVRPLQSNAIVTGPCWTNFCSQKLKRRILAKFGFNRTALRATQPKLHSMFCVLCLNYYRNISHRADIDWSPRSCDLISLDYYLWGAVEDKC